MKQGQLFELDVAMPQIRPTSENDPTHLTPDGKKVRRKPKTNRVQLEIKPVIPVIRPGLPNGWMTRKDME